jgi:hypothetical protein
VALILPFAACAERPASERPFRSPTVDYPAPPPQTSDGEVVGADRQAPSDKLEAGPSDDGLAPGWHVEDGTPRYDRKNRAHEHAPAEGDGSNAEPKTTDADRP